MGRITKKELNEQNEVLLADARQRVAIARNNLEQARIAVSSAVAVLDHAEQAYEQLQLRLNPPTEGK